MSQRSGVFAEILVSDTGPGIPPADVKSIFDPFFTTKPQGMGMGLAIVKTIVEAHSGTIVAENQPSSGALVTIRFPIANGPPIPALRIDASHQGICATVP